MKVDVIVSGFAYICAFYIFCVENLCFLANICPRVFVGIDQ